jgi:hypothetical protein
VAWGGVDWEALRPTSSLWGGRTVGPGGGRGGGASAWYPSFCFQNPHPAAAPPTSPQGGGKEGACFTVATPASFCSRPYTRFARWPPRGRAIRRDARLGWRRAWPLPRPPKRRAIAFDERSGSNVRDHAILILYCGAVSRTSPAFLPYLMGTQRQCTARPRSGPGPQGSSPSSTTVSAADPAPPPSLIPGAHQVPVRTVSWIMRAVGRVGMKWGGIFGEIEGNQGVGGTVCPR